VVREGERRREAGRLDAEKIYQAGDAVSRRAIDAKIRGWFCWSTDLRADAGVGGLQSAIG
jgi:hypothetical protein